MSPKKKERSEVEYLRGLVRELTSEVKHLKKSAGRSQKKVRQYESIIDLQAEPEVSEEQYIPPKAKCPECGSKEFDVFDIVVKELHMCAECGYRKTFPKK